MELTKNKTSRDLMKKYLGQYYRCKKKKKLLERRLKEVKKELNNPIGGMSYDGCPTSKTNIISEGAAAIPYRIREAESRILEQQEDVKISLLKIIDLMNYLPSNSYERMIIELRHIDCRTWFEISADIGLTRSPCNDYYNAGITKLLEFKRVRIMLEEYEKKGDAY